LVVPATKTDEQSPGSLIPEVVTQRKRCDAEMMSTSMVRSAELVTSPEAGDVARAPSWWRRVWRRLMPPPSAELILAQLNGRLAVLEAVRAELEAGWVQGAWWSVTSADGDRQPTTGDAGGRPAHVDGACLVGALARGGPYAGRAVDAVYDALWASRGQAAAQAAPGGMPPLPAPEVRLARVRLLTGWNDQAERTQEEVLAVVDRAISATIMDLMSAPRPAQPAQPAQCVGGP
jgi:hypothetical protein